MKIKNLAFTIFMIIALASIPLNGFAQGGTNGGSKAYYGLRIGFSQEPDQFVGGLQAHFGNIFKVGKFAPSLDIGFGDNVTVITLNGDLYFQVFTPPKSSLHFFVAGGPTLAYYNADDWGSDTEIGISGSVGLTSPMGGDNLYSLELKFGIGDVPELKVLFGLLL